MKKTLSGALLLLLAFLPGIADAAEITCFGPKQYERLKGYPNTYTDTFGARDGAATMVVTNGDADGDLRITSAVISLNGTVIFSPRDFNPRVGTLSASIQVESGNTLTVELRSNGGNHHGHDSNKPPMHHAGFFGRCWQWLHDLSPRFWKRCGFGPPHAPQEPYLTITIFQDTPAPAASLSIDPQTITPGQKAILSWDTAHADSITLDPGIGIVAPSGTLQVSPAESTIYTITATGPGGTASSAALLTVEPPALSIEITQPIDGAEIPRRMTTVSGTVSSLPDASVTVNGVPALIVSGTFVAENIPLNVGANTLTAVASTGSSTVEDTITVYVPGIDLEPFHIDLVAFNQDHQNLKVEGQARITIVNHGTGEVTGPYLLVLFEDADLNGQFDQSSDILLAEVEVASGPVAGGSKDVLVAFMGESLFRDNHLSVCLDPANLIEETSKANNTASLQRGGIDLSASLLRVDNSLCPDQSLLKVRIGNSGDDEFAPGLPVSFYSGDPQAAGTLIGTTHSTLPLSPGGYEDIALPWPNATSVQPVFAVADDDGTGHGLHVEADEENNRASASAPVCAGPQPVPNSISGLSRDASTGALLEGVQVTLHADADGVPGSILQQSITSTDGGFIFLDLTPGRYILRAAMGGYIETQRSVRLGAGQIVTHQDLVLSPLLGADGIRIVLIWGEHPQDLEAHLTGPNPDGCRHHCNYWNRQIPGAVLDVDDSDGFGPETITLTKGMAGTYRFYVHDFTNRYTQGTALSASGAHVEVYFGSGQAPLTFTVPAKAGTVWHVFDIDGQSGEVTPIDRMAFQSEPGKIDFPKITSAPVTTLTWGVPYTYAVTAGDPDPDPLTFTLLEAPPGMTLDAQTHLLQWNPELWQGESHWIVIRVTDGRCGEDTQSYYLNLSYKPAITFAVTPCSGYNPGGQITLSWSTQRADTVTIDPGIGPVAPNGSLSIDSPAIPTAYTLTARNNVGIETAKVPKKPNAQIGIEAGSLSWQTTCAAQCFIEPNIGAVPCTGTVAVSSSGPYTLNAANGSGLVTATASECTTPSIDFETEPVCGWSPGDPVTLKMGQPQCAALCQIDPGVGAVPCDGTVEVRPTEPTRYTLTATSGEQSITKMMLAPNLIAPINSFSASRTQIQPGDSVMLSWSTECAQSLAIDQGIGAVAAEGALSVTPDVLPKSYILTAISGWQTFTRTITIVHDTPSISFNATPGIIKIGESATLTWSTANATSCRIDPDIGPVAASGTITVQPARTTSYLLTAEGPGGTQTSSATVSFVRPTAQIQAEPEVLQPGQSTTLSWIFANADTCRIDPGIGEVSLGGSRVVTPTAPTIYTITAMGPGGTVTDSVRVSFVKPTVSISAEPLSVAPGQSATLTWNSAFADTCAISPSIGAVQPNGSIVVSPTVTTTYTITATGPGGSTTAGVTVGCLAPVIDFGPSIQTIHLGETATLTWNVQNAQTIWLYPLGHMPASGSVAVAPTETTQYTISLSGCGGMVSATVTVAVVCPPSLSFFEPDGVDDRANAGYLIRWADSDCDSNAALSFYYDTDNSGADGVLIASGLEEDPDGIADRYAWDTSALVEGEYFIYAIIDDGGHPPIAVYAAHAVTIDHGIAPMTRVVLSAHDGAEGDNFGGRVAMNGDYAVVGAAGAAYVFKRNGQEWNEAAKLSAAADAVAIDAETVILGDEHWGPPDVAYGAARVFVLQTGQWIEQAMLTADDHSEGVRFGGSVALSGDIAVVGAPGNGRADSGVVYVFKRESNVWAMQTKLIPNEGAVGLGFGSSLSFDGTSLIVGTRPDAGLNPGGGAFVYRLDNGAWALESSLAAGSLSLNAVQGAPAAEPVKALAESTLAADAGSEDPSALFGAAVHIQGDLAIVGSPGATEGRGAAYVFRRDASGSGWVAMAGLMGADTLPGSNFGTSVWINGDYAYVGTGDPADSSQDPGNAVYVFRQQDGAWREQLKIRSGDGAAQADFGASIAMAGGYLLVGARQDLKAGVPTGLAYVYTTCAAGLEVNPAAIAMGETATLTWGTDFADTCRLEPNIGTVAASGSIPVTPTGTTTYTLYAGGPYGELSREIKLWVGDQAPTVNLAATPAAIAATQSTTLSWASTYASEASIEPGIGPVATSGSLIVAPLHTTTYTISAIGPGGMTQAFVDVAVTVNTPTAAISAAPVYIAPGQATTLTWATAFATSVIMEPNIGVVAASGSMPVTPSANTTYTITASGPGGVATSRVAVTVSALPYVSIAADPPAVKSGQDFLLTWSSINADTCYVTPSIGAVGCDSAWWVSVEETTEFTITATNAAGSASASVFVKVTDTPRATLTADRIIINRGESAILQWTTANAARCEITPGIGTVPFNGEKSVAPTDSTLYTITAVRGDRMARAYVRVYVRNGSYYGDPTPAEQAHIEALNRARANPPEEAARFDIDLNEGPPSQPITGEPAQPLACSAKLLEAARLHARDMIDQQYYGHDSLDGRTPAERIEQAGYLYLRYAENIAWAGDTRMPFDELDISLYFHELLFVDPEYAGRGHRLNILNPDLKEVGVGLSFGPYDPYAYSAKGVCDFASAYDEPRSFLLGVVYDDLDLDGQYTAGEGLGDVQILIEETGAATVTASAGGYRIPLPAGGYTVRAVLPDGRELSKSFGVGDRNVKVDFNLTPPPRIQFSAAPEKFSPGESVVLTWAVAGADSCQITPDVGDVATSGSTTVAPTQEITYTLTAIGAGGTSSLSLPLTLKVPAVAFAANPRGIAAGGSATLAWSTSGAEMVSIDQGIGVVNPSGERVVSPSEATTYTLTAQGDGGTATAHTTVWLDTEGPTVIGITPAIGGMLEIQNGWATIRVSVEDSGSGFCGATLLNRYNVDVSHLLHIGGGIISWIVNAGDVAQYTLVLEDCAGNTASIPLNFTTVAVPADVDFGLDGQAGPDFAGATVRITNGNVLEARGDLSLPSPNQLGLGFEAFYNSRNAAISTLGRGWSHTYSVALSQPYIGGAAFIRIADATGRARYFSAVAPYAGAFGEKSQLFYLNGQYVWQRLDGARFGFESSGRLAWMDDPIGNRLQLAYSGGVMSSVTDTASGRALTFDYATYYSGGWKYILSSVSGPATAAVPDGIWVRFGYDNSQNLTEVTYADGSGIRYAYDEAAGNLTGKRNVAGHQLAAWQYDTQDRVVESQLADDAGVRLTYLDPERVQVSDAYGIERTYRLAQIHGRTKVTALESGPAAAPYGADAAVRWQYDDQLNLTEVEYAGGTAESPANTLQRFENFDARGNPGTVIQAWNTPEARTATYTYHPVRNTVLTRVEQSVLDPAQDKTTLFDYDDPAAPGDDPLIYNQNPGRLVRRVIEMGLTRTVGGAMEPYTYVTALTHNTKGQLLASDGPLEGSQDTTTYEYDPISGDLAVVTRPLVGSTTYAQYNAAGRPGTITDVNHVVKAMTYDGRGRTIEIVNQADHGRQSFIYQNGLLTQTIDPDGITRAFAYETQRGWLETISDHQGHTTVYQYDEQGNRIGQLRYDADDPATPAASAFWSYTHPELPGRLFREYSPDPNRPGQEVYSQYDYDRAGNIASATDPKGNTTAYVYDSLNRVIESNAPGAVTTYMAYDRHGNLSVVTDAEGRHTVHQYDDMGRLVSESSPDAGTTTYAYDAAGNRTHSLDGRGVAASYSPDALGRTQRIDYPAFDGQSAWSIVYSYDEGPGGKGRMTGMQDASGRTTWDYNRLDDQGVIAKTTVIENFSYDFSQSQTPGGRVTQMTYPSGRTVDYQRAECACEISGVTTTFNGQATILAADLAYRLSGMPKAMDLGNTGTANVDNRYDEAGRLTAANPDTPNAQTYRHDANGNVVNIKLEAAPWQSQTYSYDTLDRVTGAIGDFGFLDFSYDKTGNRLTRTHNGAQSVYSYASGTSRLTRITTDGVPIALTHDGHGNTTTNGSRRYTYDPANQLVRVDDTDLVAQYVYNGLGQRVIKSVNGQSTYYHYDLAGHLIAETPAGGLVSAGTEHINKGNGLLSQVDVKTGAIYGYHTNYLGAVHQLTDINGTIVWEAVYQPFGETVINAGSTVVNNWRMPGQYFDAETGLHYNYFRYYDAATGRYLTPDPIGLEGGINLYAYSLDNPVLFIDPYGLDIRTPKWAVKGFINNGKGLVSSVSNNAFSEEEMNRIIDKIWEVGSDPLMVSFGKYQPLTDPFTKQVNAFQLTKNQFEIVEEIMKRLGQKYPDDPLVKKAMEEWGKAKDKWIFHEKDGLRYCIKVLQREGEEYPCPSAVK